VITIPMSANAKHQAENLAAADIGLSQAEMEQLNELE
jgi:diketogulonate reductase-like aldo/keto reductase